MTERKLSGRFAEAKTIVDQQIKIDAEKFESWNAEPYLRSQRRHVISFSANELDSVLRSLRAAESPPAGTEPPGCPTPGACSCGGGSDAVAKAVEAEREGIWQMVPKVPTLDMLNQIVGHIPFQSRNTAKEIYACLLVAANRSRTTSPSPPFDEAAERAAFEKCFQDTYGYVSDDTLLWCAWRARAQKSYEN